MNRLQKYLENGKVWDELVQYPNDILVITKLVPELSELTDIQVEDLYSAYSQAVYAAGWMNLEPEDLKGFRKWITSEPDPSGEYYPPTWYTEKEKGFGE